MVWGKLLDLPEEKDRFGLGYKSTNKEVQKPKKKSSTISKKFSTMLDIEVKIIWFRL